MIVQFLPEEDTDNLAEDISLDISKEKTDEETV
jgi:hypothetical protein